MSDDAADDADYQAAMQEALAEYKARPKPEWQLEDGGEYTRCPGCRSPFKLMSRMVGDVREWMCGECCEEWETEE